MNKLVESIQPLHGYKMNNQNINILCYADDAILIADSEDNLQRLLYRLVTTAKKYNMLTSTEETKSMVISKEPIRCKLEVEGHIIEQVMKFKYLGFEISSYGNTLLEVREQTLKAARISGCLRDVVWKNKYMSIESKVKIYKTAVRPILTYAVETRADTSKTKQLLRTTEMNTLRTIIGKTRRDRVKNVDVRKECCEIQDVVKFTKKRTNI